MPPFPTGAPGGGRVSLPRDWPQVPGQAGRAQHAAARRWWVLRVGWGGGGAGEKEHGAATARQSSSHIPRAVFCRKTIVLVCEEGRERLERPRESAGVLSVSFARGRSIAGYHAIRLLARYRAFSLFLFHPLPPLPTI